MLLRKAADVRMLIVPPGVLTSFAGEHAGHWRQFMPSLVEKKERDADGGLAGHIWRTWPLSITKSTDVLMTCDIVLGG